MKTPKEIIFEYSSKTKSELIKVEQLKEIYEGSFTLMEVIGMIKMAQEEAKVFSSNAVLSNSVCPSCNKDDKALPIENTHYCKRCDNEWNGRTV